MSETGQRREQLTQTPRALILLAGGGRPTEFRSAIQRPVLDLPADDDRTLFGRLCDQAEELASRVGEGSLHVRLLVDDESKSPTFGALPQALVVSVEQDPFGFRGTAGVLADLAREYDDDDLLLVANAAQVNLLSLAEQYAAMVPATLGVTLFAPSDETPASCMLVRCRALRTIPEIGFCDLKEQALGGIAKEHGVAVVRGAHPVGYPLLNLNAYIRTVRDVARRTEYPDLLEEHPFEELWQPRFSIVEDGAEVHPTAQVLDSVVLSGAMLEQNCAVVRSLVCPGGVVRKGGTVIERIVAPQRPASIRAGRENGVRR